RSRTCSFSVWSSVRLLCATTCKRTIRSSLGRRAASAPKRQASEPPATTTASAKATRVRGHGSRGLDVRLTMLFSSLPSARHMPPQVFQGRLLQARHLRLRDADFFRHFHLRAAVEKALGQDQPFPFAQPRQRFPDGNPFNPRGVFR